MVLYLLNAAGELIGRTMYKVKPRDIEEVHWSQFDPARVREGVEKLIRRQKEMNVENVRAELDMGPKEWSRFGKQVMPYLQQLAFAKLPSISRDRRRLLLVMGRRYAGHEEVALVLRTRGWRMLTLTSGGNLGTVFDWLTAEPLLDAQGNERVIDTKVVVHHTFLSFRQRKPLLAAASRAGLLRVQVLVLDYPPVVLAARGVTRKPSLDQAKLAKSLEEEEISRPFARDGYTDIFTVTTEAEYEKAMDEIQRAL
jgi:hypothetical protein